MCVIYIWGDKTRDYRTKLFCQFLNLYPFLLLLLLHRPHPFSLTNHGSIQGIQQYLNFINLFSLLSVSDFMIHSFNLFIYFHSVVLFIYWSKKSINLFFLARSSVDYVNFVTAPSIQRLQFSFLDYKFRCTCLEQQLIPNRWI